MLRPALAPYHHRRRQPKRRIRRSDLLDTQDPYQPISRMCGAHSATSASGCPTLRQNAQPTPLTAVASGLDSKKTDLARKARPITRAPPDSDALGTVNIANERTRMACARAPAHAMSGGNHRPTRESVLEQPKPGKQSRVERKGGRTQGLDRETVGICDWTREPGVPWTRSPPEAYGKPQFMVPTEYARRRPARSGAALPSMLSKHAPKTAGIVAAAGEKVSRPTPGCSVAASKHQYEQMVRHAELHQSIQRAQLQQEQAASRQSDPNAFDRQLTRFYREVCTRKHPRPPAFTRAHTQSPARARVRVRVRRRPSIVALHRLCESI